jgi:type VI secretion system protein ImpJ
MHLAQHHFQTQSRYFESSVHFALSHLFFRSYGLAGIELDAEALRNGTVSLLHARGVMPDGLTFNFPESDPLPAAREIRDLFSPTQASHLVLLTIPPYRHGRANCQFDEVTDSSDVRYLSEASEVVDETTGQDKKPVEIGRKNYRLALDAENTDDLVALPLARVKRDRAGHFIYDPEYIPPSLQVGASQCLVQLLSRLIDMLDSKSDTLAAKRKADHQDLAEYAAHEVASFWLSHTIQSSLGPLRHHFDTRRSRPEQLFMELSRLAGALCTFSLSAHARDLPQYDHDNLADCFGRLDRHIRENLDVIIPTNLVSIPLERTKEYLFMGRIVDQRCFGRSHWLLGVRSSVGDAALISQVPRLVKICSGKHIQRLVKEGIAGLNLDHLPAPPAAVSPRIGSQYFSIAQAGPCWKAMNQTSEVGLYVPEAIRDAELELLIVLES